MLENENSLLDRLQKSMFDITLKEGIDDRLRRLARAGLIADDEYALFIKMMKDMEDEKVLTPKQRMLTVRLFDKLLGLITKDNVDEYYSMLDRLEPKYGDNLNKNPDS